MFAIDQVLLGWKTYTGRNYDETGELPNPRKNRLKVVFGPLFPTANIFSWWVGIDFIWETDHKKRNPTKFSGTHLEFLLKQLQQPSGTDISDWDWSHARAKSIHQPINWSLNQPINRYYYTGGSIDRSIVMVRVRVHLPDGIRRSNKYGRQ